jgi:hypothetical protein
MAGRIQGPARPHNHDLLPIKSWRTTGTRRYGWVSDDAIGRELSRKGAGHRPREGRAPLMVLDSR